MTGSHQRELDPKLLGRGFVALLLVLLLAGCAQSGSMVSDDVDPATGGLRRTNYSKYFDAGVWIIPGKLGLSVVIDNDTPLSRQMFGSLQGTDADGVGKVTLYFWNLDSPQLAAHALEIRHHDSVLSSKGDVTIGPGPYARTGFVAGNVPFFAYATELKFDVALEINGTPWRQTVVVQRRTFSELRRYFGPNGTPPYPWYAPEYAQKTVPGKN
ncbi:MAG TPA: hypothetical protein VHD32_03110 [Candidatus Didemnitutus sp.]|nr:hypothetical protein [Candidatus Didemnitutus sp.]